MLVAPSLWPEPFGLVSVEAGLRGLPCLSTNLGGLGEANLVAEHVVQTKLVHDPEADATFFCDGGLAAFEALRPRVAAALLGDAAFPPGSRLGTPADVDKLAEAFSEKLDPLFAGRGDALRRASEKAFAAATAHVEERRHSLAARLRRECGG